MTDGYPDPGTTAAGAGDDDRPDRMTLLLGGGLAVVLLAAVGATGGYLLAGEDEPGRRTPVAAPTSAAAPTDGPTDTRPTPARTTAPAVRTTAPTTSTGLIVPELVGTDFAQARDELRERRLGWRLVFGTGSGREVARTVPAAGAPVRRGTTVLVHVTGPAPAQTVPDVVGDDCDDAADDLVEEGFYPRYRTGRTGTVTAQVPPAGATAYWNDEVAVSCGDDGGDGESPGPAPASPTP